MTAFSEEPMVATLSEWVRIESPTYEKDAVNRMADLVAQSAAAAVGVERIAGRDGLGDILALRAGPRTSEPGILLLGHIDTVHPLGTLHGPLPLRRVDDRLYGPGVYDMKGGVLIALEAFKAAARAKPRLPLTLLITPDEEIGSPTTQGLIEAEARHAAYALVTEPGRNGGKIVTARKGVGRFDVRCIGRPAHAGSRHADGRSAIREAARQVLAVEAMTDYARGITIAVGLISGGTAENVIPQVCTFTVDLRVTDAGVAQEMEARILALENVDPDVEVTVTGGMNRPPYAKTPAIARLYEFARECAADLGFDLHDLPQVGGGSDGNFTAALGVPTLDGIGIDGAGAHTHEEYGVISSIVPRTRLLERLLLTLH